MRRLVEKDIAQICVFYSMRQAGVLRAFRLLLALF